MKLKTRCSPRRFRECALAGNRVFQRENLDHILPKPGKLKRGHNAAVPYGELPAITADLRKREAVAARALEFAILTAARSG